MKKRLISVFMVTAMSLGIISGCQPKEETTSKTVESKTEDTKKEEVQEEKKITDEPMELSLYTYYTDQSKILVDKSLEKIKEKYPNLTIEVEHRADSDGEVLKTRSAIGELPDIFECTGALTDIFIKSGDIVPYDDIMTRENYKAEFMEKAFDGKSSPDGKMYALGTAVPQNALFFYNKKVFADNNLVAPKNYTEFMTLVETLKKTETIPLALFAQQKWPGLQIYDLAVIAEGEPKGISALEDGAVSVTSEPFVKAATKLQGLIDAGIIGKGAFNTNASQAFEMVKVGQAAMLFNGAWYFTDAADYGDNIGYFEYNPFSDEGKEDDLRWNVSGGVSAVGGYTINAKSKNVEMAQLVAMELVKQRELVGAYEFGAISMASEVIEPKSPRSEAFQTFVDNIPNYKTLSNYEWSLKSPELTVALEDQVEKLFAGGYPADKFISDLDKLISMIE